MDVASQFAAWISSPKDLSKLTTCTVDGLIGVDVGCEGGSGGR